jgi:hypothetical protein
LSQSIDSRFANHHGGFYGEEGKEGESGEEDEASEEEVDLSKSHACSHGPGESRGRFFKSRSLRLPGPEADI